MRLSRNGALLALPLAAALVLAGCGGGGDAGSGDQTVSLYSTDPENPLIPGDTNEVGGGNPVKLIWTGLFSYDPKTGNPVKQMAQSVDKTSPTTYDITIKKGWKFHDGTEVKARNFVDAWNYTAYAPNAQTDSNYLSPIKGYTDVSPEGENAKPKAKTLSGLKTTGDYTFQVTLARPLSTFPKQLGYAAFYPMPDSFFQAKDKDEWAKKPVGNGPMKFVSYEPNTSIKLTRNDGYKGGNKVQFKNVTWKIYEKAEAGYQDLLASNLDYSDTLPPSALAGGKWQQDLADRHGQKEVMTFAYLGLPQYIKAYKDPNLRKAISLAIDRKSITKNIYNGARTPADGWVPPIIPGAKQGACGDLCTYNPQRAKQFLAKSGYKGDVVISSNSDGGNKEWIEAACGQITKALGLKCRLDMQSSFGQFSDVIDSKKAQGPYRGSWVADFPTVDNFLTELYSTNGANNNLDYSNPDFDKKLQQAGAAKDEQAGTQLYTEAEQMLAKDMPVVPLWYYNVPYGWSDKLGAVSQSLLNQPYVPGFRLANS